MKKEPCGECGEMVDPTERHTYEDCLKWRASLKPTVPTPPFPINIARYDHEFMDWYNWWLKADIGKLFEKFLVGRGSSWDHRDLIQWLIREMLK